MIDLKTVLRADAIACLVTSVALMAFASTLAPLMTRGVDTVAGLPIVTAFHLLGALVFAVGFFVLMVAQSAQLGWLGLAPILLVEIVWIVASLWLVIAAPSALTGMGIAAIALSALAVLAFFILEVIGLRALQRGGARAA